MIVLRATFALAVTGLAVWLLLEGLPFGALAVVLLAVWLRRFAETGRFRMLRRGSAA